MRPDKASEHQLCIDGCPAPPLNMTRCQRRVRPTAAIKADTILEGYPIINLYDRSALNPQRMPTEPEFELTVRKVTGMDLETMDEVSEWRVEADALDTPCAGESPAEALRVMAECLEADSDDDIHVDVTDLLDDTPANTAP